MKKMFALILAILITVPTTSVFASETDSSSDLNLKAYENEIIYQDLEITVRSFGDNPQVAEQIEQHPDSVTTSTETDRPLLRGTFTGSGGKSTLNSGSNRRIIYWSVQPKTSWPWTFHGDLKLRYYSGFKRDVALFGAGALGSTYSGSVELNANNGGTVSLTGTAFEVGTGSFHTVIPGASIAF